MIIEIKIMCDHSNYTLEAVKMGHRCHMHGKIPKICTVYFVQCKCEKCNKFTNYNKLYCEYKWEMQGLIKLYLQKIKCANS